MNKKKILITSSSTKHSLVNSVFKNLKGLDVEILLGDTNPDAPSKYYGYNFLIMPKVPNKFEIIYKLLKDNDVTHVIPTREEELIFWSKFNKKFAGSGIKVIVSDEKPIKDAQNKFILYKKLYENGYNAIPTYKSLKNLNIKDYVVKEAVSNSPNKTIYSKDKSFSNSLVNKYKSPIFQPRIKGVEISIDAYCSFNSENIYLICRERRYLKDGESFLTKTFRSKTIESEAVKILKLLDLKGPVMLQGIIDKNNKIFWMECNPRFGGASNAGITMGLNVWRWSIRELENDKYIPSFRRTRNEIVQAKSINDHVFEINDRYMKLQKKLVNKKMSKKELKAISYAIWEWRNDPISRKFSKNTKIISFSTHEIWFNKIISSKKHKLYIFTAENEYVSVIRLDQINGKVYEININTNPEFRGFGLSGDALMHVINENSDKVIKAFIHKSNSKSINLFKKLEFKMINDKPKFKVYEYKK